MSAPAAHALIAAKDRDDRKHGFAVDTAGAITRALERAYRQGFAEAQEPPKAVADVAESLEWALIPPRSRTAFWSLCLSALGRGDGPEGTAHIILPATTERGTPG